MVFLRLGDLHSILLSCWEKVVEAVGDDPHWSPPASVAVEYHRNGAIEAYMKTNSIAWERLPRENVYLLRASKRWAQFANDVLRRPDVAYNILNRALLRTTKRARERFESQVTNADDWLRQNLEFPSWFEMGDDPLKDRVAFSLTNGNLYPVLNALQQDYTNLIGANDLPITPLPRANMIMAHIFVRINLSSPVVH